MCNLSKFSNFRGFYYYFMPRGYNNSKGRAINKLLLQKNCDKIRFLWEAKKGVLISNPKTKIACKEILAFQSFTESIAHSSISKKADSRMECHTCEPHSKLIGEHVPKLQLFVS